MSFLFIMNPGSKSGRSRRSIEEIIKILDREKIDYDYRVTKGLEDAYRFSLEGNRSGYEVIVAVGGDGTINRVLNGFYGNDGRRLSQAKLGVIYTGTSPDFCKSYDIPLDLEEAVQAVIKKRTKKIQVGMIVCAEKYFPEYDGKSVPTNDLWEDYSGFTTGFNTRYFACCANIGLGAALARRANMGVRGFLGDTVGTFMALVRTLLSYKPGHFIISADGKREEVKKVHSISIGKTFYIASGIKVNHDLLEGNQRFYRMTVKNLSFMDLPGIIKKIYSGKKIINNDVIFLDYLETIDVFGNNRNPEIEFDGDPGGFLPCRISMAHDDLELIENTGGRFFCVRKRLCSY